MIMAGKVRHPSQASDAGVLAPPIEKTIESAVEEVAEFPCIGKAKRNDITSNAAQMRRNRKLFIVQHFSIGHDQSQEPIIQSSVRQALTRTLYRWQKPAYLNAS